MLDLKYPTFSLTGEQCEILDAFKKGGNLKIHAFAGTGKTFTLIHLSKQTKKKGLYFAFNRRIADEGKEKMPDNVTVATVHGFAWKWASVKFKIEKLVKSPSYRTVNKDKEINVPKSAVNEDKEINALKIKKFPARRFINVALQTVENFCQSKDSAIHPGHIPETDESTIFDKKILEKHESDFINVASQIWDKMKNPQESFPLGHDGYLKLWSMSEPDLSAYDFLFVDEGQDLNSVMLKILDNYSGQKIVVGDAQQQIYAWRGAKNAMEYEFGAQDLYLTKTFRFGDTLAEIANNTLKHLCVKKRIISAKSSGTSVTTDPSNFVNAYLFRKNVSLIETALIFFRQNKEFYIADPNKKITSIVEDYFRLNKGDWGESTIFMDYNSWENVVHAAQDVDYENHLKNYVKLFQENNPIEIQKAVESSKKKESNAYPTFSTIHQAKGLEWSDIYLDDDFILDFGARDFSEAKEELRLLYVGLTRAKKRLVISERLFRFCAQHLAQNDPEQK